MNDRHNQHAEPRTPSGPVEAVEARPWRASDGPAPRLRIWEPGRQPQLEVFVAGEWRRCVVLARADWPGGRVSYQVEVTLTVGGVRGTYVRSYWWNARSMRPVSGPGRA